MVKLIVGKKGSGKTKRLVDMANAAAEHSKGNVICIEKNRTLTYMVPVKVRLVETSDYKISGYDALYGFIAGIMARDYDATDIFIDGVRKIGGGGMPELAKFIEKLTQLSAEHAPEIVMTVSSDISELPEALNQFVI